MPTTPHIDDYSFGRIVIDGTRYTDDVIVHPCCVDDTWWRREGHLLQMADLREVLEAIPDVLVVGSGAYGRMRVADEVRRALAERDVELIVAETAEACEQYNELAPERRTVAALHLSC